MLSEEKTTLCCNRNQLIASDLTCCCWPRQCCRLVTTFGADFGELIGNWMLLHCCGGADCCDEHLLIQNGTSVNVSVGNEKLFYLFLDLRRNT